MGSRLRRTLDRSGAVRLIEVSAGRATRLLRCLRKRPSIRLRGLKRRGDTTMGAGRGVSDADPEPISRDLILAQLGHILASRGFDASRRNRAFLRFIVEESLAGHADRIKAYTIATGVLGRDEAFDPQSDPIVRIEASRLRRSLERYYLLAGQDDPIRIDIPKWGYVPSFQRLQGVRDDCALPHHAYAPEPPREELPALPEPKAADGARRDRQSAGASAPPCSGRLGSGGVRHGGHRARDRPLALGRAN